MGRDPDAEHSNVDTGDDNSCTPFYPGDCSCILGDDCDSVDDDLQK